MSLLLREKLATELYSAYWRDLSAHALRDTVFLVGSTVEILDAGEALAANDTDKVRQWIADGSLSRPSREQLDTWQPGKIFACLIVQPFVLIQETALPDEDVPPAEEVVWEELIQFLRRRP